MKKLILTAILVVAVLCVFAPAGGSLAASAAALAATRGGTIKIINDTDADVQIHTGSGFVEINKTSSTSVSCEAGKVVSLAEKGKKKGELFTIDDSMCGKTIKLSKYM